ncbi:MULTISPECIES: SymE family type I addiction module toxin [Desulfitobacterium]|uniref:Toxin SymE-like domain-containing protein n=1 Tax=Desulfitobacterium dehalogenans (strain ATCC 51507 / DSM 9161 / JW/IU-DC1) TaxID=756499 RepID=I4A858_DESDJ|nr:MULTISPECIES: SymE family type I addiction module toxin [Desulfitobacterium]AFM00143.1 protein of unknown function (DUF1813) [Desulfitobacterium dehalogenans ATCC 51507]
MDRITGTGTRILTVAYTHQNGVERPFIRLRGKWLQELGFLPGAKIEVRETKDGLVIKALPLPEQADPFQEDCFLCRHGGITSMVKET